MKVLQNKMKKIIWCKKCVLPNTRPNLKINKFGICNACENSEIKKPWKKKLKKLKKIIKKNKKKA